MKKRGLILRFLLKNDGNGFYPVIAIAVGVVANLFFLSLFEVIKAWVR